MRFNAKYEEWMDDTALSLFAEGKSVVAVSCALNISRETYYEWRDNPNHPFYPIAQRGEMLSQQHWEDRGQSGIFGETDKFNSSGWQFVLKNRFRKDYKEEQKEDGNTAVEMLIKMLADKNDK